MSGKDAFIEFVTTVVALLTFAFVVFFIILGDRFDMVVNFFVSIIPLAIFSLIAIIILNLRKRELRKKKEDSNYEITLFLNYGDRLTSDMVYTGLPVLILFVAFISEGSIQLDDVIQSSLVMAVLYFYFKTLYNKKS